MPQHKKLSLLPLRINPSRPKNDEEWQAFLAQLQNHFNAIASLDVCSGLTGFGDTTNKGYFLGFSRGVAGITNGTPVFVVGDRGEEKYFAFDGTDLSLGVQTSFHGVNAFNNQGHFRYFSFESIDGYTSSTSGSGTVSVDGVGARLSTGTTAGATAELLKDIGTTISAGVGFKATMFFTNALPDAFFLGVGVAASGVRIGFEKSGSEIVGVCSDGTSTTNVSLTAISLGSTLVLKLLVNQDESVDFSVKNSDGEVAGSISSNVPIGQLSRVAVATVEAAAGGANQIMVLQEVLSISPS